MNPKWMSTEGRLGKNSRISQKRSWSPTATITSELELSTRDQGFFLSPAPFFNPPSLPIATGSPPLNPRTGRFAGFSL